MPLWKRIKESLIGGGRLRNHLYRNLELESFITELLGFTPKNIQFYERAFIHRSAQLKDSKGNDINFERLEFLGDAVIGLVVAKFIFEESPNEQEGYLTKMRSKIVSRKQLNSIGKEFGLLKMLVPKSNNNFGDDINGDLLEALIGAVYLDKGFKFATDFIMKNIIKDHIDLDKLESYIASYKSLILEWGQKTKNKITFNTFEEEDNEEDLMIFNAVIRLNEKVVSKGRGTSKKRAEENAAKRAYYSLQKEFEKVR